MPLTELALNMVLPEHKLERMERHKIFAAVLLCLVRMGEPASGFFMSSAVLRLLPSGNGLPVSVCLSVCLFAGHIFADPQQIQHRWDYDPRLFPSSVALPSVCCTC